MFARWRGLEEEIDDSIALLAAARAAEIEEASKYLRDFPRVLARLPTAAAVRARMRQELADAEDDDLIEEWVEVSRRCARMAQRRLLELEGAEAAAREDQRRTEERRGREEETARAKSAEAARLRRQEEEARAARLRSVEAARAERLRRKAEEAERGRLVAEKAAREAKKQKQLRPGHTHPREAEKHRADRAGRGTEFAGGRAHASPRGADATVRGPHAEPWWVSAGPVDQGGPSPGSAPARDAHTGADLAAYRQQRGLTVGLASRELMVDRGELVAAEAAPNEPLSGSLAEGLQALLERQRAVDALLPPEAPPRSGGQGATGDTLLAWRQREGLTQTAAAERLGVSQGYVAKAEGAPGKALGPTLRGAFGKVA